MGVFLILSNNNYERNTMTKIIDIKSLLIGFLLATSVMLFMGATSDNGNGRYQMHMGEVLVDTQTGEVYEIRESSDGYYFEKVTRDENWIVR